MTGASLGGDGDITISDVAARAGVSIRTVSRVLNGSSLVNAETRERVQATIGTLRYYPSARARGLATGRSYLIGILHNDRNALVIDVVMRGIVSEAGQRGYELVVHPASLSDKLPLEDVMRFVRRSRVDGVVIMPPVWEIAGVAEALEQAGIPAIMIGSVPVAGFPASMTSDERAGAGQVAEHLLALGHRRIATISGPADAQSARERRAGFNAALDAASCPLLADVEGDYSFDSGVAAAERLLAMTPRPTAIFTANDVMAAGVLKQAAAREIAVPDDLSVVGFDGSMLALMVTPALTTVDRPMKAMAARATACLIDLIERKDTHTELREATTLIMGQTTAPPPAD